MDEPQVNEFFISEDDEEEFEEDDFSFHRNNSPTLLAPSQQNDERQPTTPDHTKTPAAPVKSESDTRRSIDDAQNHTRKEDREPSRRPRSERNEQSKTNDDGILSRQNSSLTVKPSSQISLARPVREVSRKPVSPPPSGRRSGGNEKSSSETRGQRSAVASSDRRRLQLIDSLSSREKDVSSRLGSSRQIPDRGRPTIPYPGSSRSTVNPLRRRSSRSPRPRDRRTESSDRRRRADMEEEKTRSGRESIASRTPAPRHEERPYKKDERESVKAPISFLGKGSSKTEDVKHSSPLQHISISSRLSQNRRSRNTRSRSPSAGGAADRYRRPRASSPKSSPSVGKVSEHHRPTNIAAAPESDITAEANRLRNQLQRDTLKEPLATDTSRITVAKPPPSRHDSRRLHPNSSIYERHSQLSEITWMDDSTPPPTGPAADRKKRPSDHSSSSLPTAASFSRRPLISSAAAASSASTKTASTPAVISPPLRSTHSRVNHQRNLDVGNGIRGRPGNGNRTLPLNKLVGSESMSYEGSGPLSSNRNPTVSSSSHLDREKRRRESDDEDHTVKGGEVAGAAGKEKERSRNEPKSDVSPRANTFPRNSPTIRPSDTKIAHDGDDRKESPAKRISELSMPSDANSDSQPSDSRLPDSEVSSKSTTSSSDAKVKVDDLETLDNAESRDAAQQPPYENALSGSSRTPRPRDTAATARYAPNRGSPRMMSHSASETFSQHSGIHHPSNPQLPPSRHFGPTDGSAVGPSHEFMIDPAIAAMQQYQNHHHHTMHGYPSHTAVDMMGQGLPGYPMGYHAGGGGGDMEIMGMNMGMMEGMGMPNLAMMNGMMMNGGAGGSGWNAAEIEYYNEYLQGNPNAMMMMMMNAHNNVNMGVNHGGAVGGHPMMMMPGTNNPAYAQMHPAAMYAAAGSNGLPDPKTAHSRGSKFSKWLEEQEKKGKSSF